MCIGIGSIALLFKKWFMNDPWEAIAQMVGVLAGGCVAVGLIAGLLAPAATFGLLAYRLTHVWPVAVCCGVLAFLLTMVVIGTYSERKDKIGTPGATA
jgi:hypothetical protein